MSGKLSRSIFKEYYGDTDRLLADIDARRTVKIRRTGNASGITLPRKWLRQLNWSEGDILKLQLNKSQGTITLQKLKLQEDPRR